MKILLLSTLLILSSCSIGGGVSDSVTEVRPASAVGSSGSTDPYQIGTVDTAFQLLGPDHKIEVGGVPDPKVSGITCFYSRAKTGGIKG
jgi:catabolite regulation protein CreA